MSCLLGSWLDPIDYLEYLGKLLGMGKTSRGKGNLEGSVAAGMGRARYALKTSQVETGESPGREL